MMKTAIKALLFTFAFSFTSVGLAQGTYQDCGTYTTDGDENTNCSMGTCCQVWNACNGPYSPCYNYDPDYSSTGGCDLSCAPIDSGVLFLLLGGAAFGGMMIMRRREHATQIIR